MEKQKQDHPRFDPPWEFDAVQHGFGLIAEAEVLFQKAGANPDHVSGIVSRWDDGQGVHDTATILQAELKGKEGLSVLAVCVTAAAFVIGFGTHWRVAGYLLGGEPYFRVLQFGSIMRASRVKSDDESVLREAIEEAETRGEQAAQSKIATASHQDRFSQQDEAKALFMNRDGKWGSISDAVEEIAPLIWEGRDKYATRPPASISSLVASVRRWISQYVHDDPAALAMLNTEAQKRLESHQVRRKKIASK